jgi:hypothetical protein
MKDTLRQLREILYAVPGRKVAAGRNAPWNFMHDEPIAIVAHHYAVPAVNEPPVNRWLRVLRWLRRD